MATQHEELVGTYMATKWQSSAGDYLIGELAEGQTVKGTAKIGDLMPGATYRFYGKWRDGNGKYGPAFHFDVATESEPRGRTAIVAYLVRHLAPFSTGVGPVRAGKLYDTFGEQAVEVLADQPKRAAEILFDGRPTENQWNGLERAAAALAADAKLRNAKIQLHGMFEGSGFPGATIQQCLDRWGPKAPFFVKRDPFLLLTAGIRGAGFQRCDALYLRLGGHPAKLKRQALCGWYALKTDGQGHTWHAVGTVIQAVKRGIAGTEAKPAKAIKLAVRAGWMTERTDSKDQKWLAEANSANGESDIARIVRSLLLAPSCWPEVSGESLSDHQREQLATATSKPLGFLVGTPGTGKTWCAAALIKTIVRIYGLGAVAACAPTGKAAARLSEILNDYGVPIEATTIHRMLRPDEAGYGTAEWKFAHNEECPLPYQFIVADETSMDDVSIMAALLRACRAGHHLLFLGDPYQLPPVGHGAPLRDMLAAGMPQGMLTEVRRNGGLIVEACAAIKDGRPFASARTLDDYNNLRVVAAGSPATAVNTLRSLVSAVVAKGKYDPFDDVQVIVALNEKSELSRLFLNPILQEILNQSGGRAEGNKYRAGDKVICTENGKYPAAPGYGDNQTTDFNQGPIAGILARRQQARGHAVFNGEMGRVLEVAPEYSVMEFPDAGDGERVVKITVKGELASAFTLGYAITCHKSQGSEWRVVVVLTDDAANRVVSREWYYTAVSRAKQRCIIIGSLALMLRQCKRIVLPDRKTFLRELLTGELT